MPIQRHDCIDEGVKGLIDNLGHPQILQSGFTLTCHHALPVEICWLWCKTHRRNGSGVKQVLSLASCATKDFAPLFGYK